MLPKIPVGEKHHGLRRSHIYQRFLYLGHLKVVVVGHVAKFLASPGAKRYRSAGKGVAAGAAGG